MSGANKMDSLWEKISSYNIFNNLFPGALFIYLLERSTNVGLSTDDLVKNVVLYYFVGLIIGRVGSLVFEPMLKIVRLIKFVPYGEYVAACKSDNKIESLQETANMYRTLFSMSLLLIVALYVVAVLTGHKYILSKCMALSFGFIFIVSYVKQINYIVMRVKKANKLP